MQQPQDLVDNAVAQNEESRESLPLSTLVDEHADLVTSINQLSIDKVPGRSPTHASPSRSRCTPRTARKSPQKQRLIKRAPLTTSNKSTTSTLSSDSRANISTSALDGVDHQRLLAPSPAVALARLCFAQELESHADQQNAKSSTVIIIQDACYGHRYSRTKTPRAYLDLIVERPERIQAAVLGIASAYVRLGGRYTGGSRPLHPKHLDTTGAPFRIRKTDRLVPLTSSSVTAVHGTKWMQELTSMCNDAEVKLSSGGKELSRPENSRSGSSIPKAKLHEGDLYLCKESLGAFEGALGGVFEAVDMVLRDQQERQQPKRAFVCIRPPGHHCSADFPSGFCWINNVHVGIEYAVQNHNLTHAAIIDFDLHHGDGSQAITWERNARAAKISKNLKRATIGYFSLHDINSYPCEYGDTEKVQGASLCIEGSHGQSIWNIHLQAWKTEDEFWQLYQTRYLELLTKTRRFLKAQSDDLRSAAPAVQSKAAIFVSAGFDASEWEGEGMQRHKVNVPTEFYARFTADIAALAEEEGLAVDGRVISVLEGGYSNRALISGVLGHISGLVNPSHTSKDQTADDTKDLESYSTAAYSPDWTSLTTLSQLEDVVENATTVRRATTYLHPTQSFTAKAVNPASIQKTPTPRQNMTAHSSAATVIPDVEWSVGAHELSKLLIPRNCRIDSYKYEELVQPRNKRERHSATGVLGEERKDGRQLRDRRSKALDLQSSGNGNITVVKTLTERRRSTISGTPALADDAADVPLPAVEVPIVNVHHETSRVAGRTPLLTQPAPDINTLRASRPKLPTVSKTEISQRRQSARKSLISEVPKLPSSASGVAIAELTSNVRKITLKMSSQSISMNPEPVTTATQKEADEAVIRTSSGTTEQTGYKPRAARMRTTPRTSTAREPLPLAAADALTTQMMQKSAITSSDTPSSVIKPDPSDKRTTQDTTTPAVMRDRISQHSPSIMNSHVSASAVPQAAPALQSGHGPRNTIATSAFTSNLKSSPTLRAPSWSTTSAAAHADTTEPLMPHSTISAYGLLTAADLGPPTPTASPFISSSGHPQHKYGPIPCSSTPPASLASINNPKVPLPFSAAQAPNSDSASACATATSNGGHGASPPPHPKVRLPTFSAVGHIPFASQSQTVPPRASNVHRPISRSSSQLSGGGIGDIWEVPETPRR